MLIYFLNCFFSFIFIQVSFKYLFLLLFFRVQLHMRETEGGKEMREKREELENQGKENR